MLIDCMQLQVVIVSKNLRISIQSKKTIGMCSKEGAKREVTKGQVQDKLNRGQKISYKQIHVPEKLDL